MLVTDELNILWGPFRVNEGAADIQLSTIISQGQRESRTYMMVLRFSSAMELRWIGSGKLLL